MSHPKGNPKRERDNGLYTKRVTLTQDFTKLHEVNSVQRYGYNVKLDGFVNLKLCKIDMDRVIEFLSTLNEDDVATVTNH